MAERVFVGVDIGAESGRVIASAFGGRRVRLDELHRFGNGPVEIAGSWRWDVLGLWNGIQIGLQAAGAKYGDSVTSVGVETGGVDCVLLSKSGELLGQPFPYRDARNAGVMEWAFGRLPRAAIFAATGLQFLPFNTLYQLIACRERTPELLDAADRLLLMPD